MSKHMIKAFADANKDAKLARAREICEEISELSGCHHAIEEILEDRDVVIDVELFTPLGSDGFVEPFHTVTSIFIPAYGRAACNTNADWAWFDATSCGDAADQYRCGEDALKGVDLSEDCPEAWKAARVQELEDDRQTDGAYGFECHRLWLNGETVGYAYDLGAGYDFSEDEPEAYDDAQRGSWWNDNEEESAERYVR